MMMMMMMTRLWSKLFAAVPPCVHELGLVGGQEGSHISMLLQLTQLMLIRLNRLPTTGFYGRGIVVATTTAWTLS